MSRFEDLRRRVQSVADRVAWPGSAASRPVVRTLFPGVDILRANEDAVRMPNTHQPCICVVLESSLILHQSKQVRQVGPGNIIVSDVDTPELGYVRTGRLTALLVHFTLDEVASVLTELDDALPRTALAGVAGDERAMDPLLWDSLDRLVGLRERPADIGFMARHLRREVIYRLVTGPQGAAAVRSLTSLQNAAQMYYVNSWIKRNYRKSFTVEDLARQNDMSVSAFHRKFKTAVQMGPLQCQKQLRLNEARRLLLDETTSVNDAAVWVGYESVSQFTREYRREFGKPPKQDIADLRQRLRALAYYDGLSSV